MEWKSVGLSHGSSRANWLVVDCNPTPLPTHPSQGSIPERCPWGPVWFTRLMFFCSWSGWGSCVPCYHQCLEMNITPTHMHPSPVHCAICCMSMPTPPQPSHIQGILYPLSGFISLPMFLHSFCSTLVLIFLLKLIPPPQPHLSFVPLVCRLHPIWYQHIPKALYPLNWGVSTPYVEVRGNISSWLPSVLMHHLFPSL